MKKIVITGPESSGKSTLAKLLSQYYNSTLIDEYAVEYLNNKIGKYDFRDLLKIAKGQILLEDNAISNNSSKFIFCDTDLITIKIWSKVRYNKVSQKIMRIIRKRQYDYYLLCKPDIPWTYSKFRENPNDRDWLLGLYEKELIKYNKEYSIISGNSASRIKSSIEIINELNF